MLQKIKTIILIFLVSGIICLPIILPYFNNKYFPTHDGEWAVVRAAEMFRELRDLQFPPRYSGALNFGYGYPLFNFVYPGPYYLTTILHFLGFGFIGSVKALFVLSTILSFMGMFLLSRKFWKNDFAGFISGFLYVYLPYRLVDLFVRGSLGESVSFAIYPFILYFSLFIIEKKRVKNAICVNSILFAFLIITHNISAVYFGIIYLVFLATVYFSKEKKSVVFTLTPLVWGALISFYFWAVAIIEKSNILLSEIPIADRGLYYVTFNKLIYSNWGYGVPTDKDPFTYSLGVAQIIGLIISVFIIFKIKDRFEKNLTKSFIVLTLIFITMMFSISSFLWSLPLLSEINYPWTLLLPLGFLTSLLSGSVINLKNGKLVGTGIILLAIVLYLPIAKPSNFIERDDNFYLTNEATTTSSNELMPLWVKKQPSKRFENKIEADATSLVYKSNKISFNTLLNAPKTITISQIYYPGWKAYLNGKETGIFYDNLEGNMQLNLPAGNNSVVVKFTETPFRLFTNIVSILSFSGLILFFFYSIIKR